LYAYIPPLVALKNNRTPVEVVAMRCNFMPSFADIGLIETIFMVVVRREEDVTM
jgi:hypothetical protein